MPTEQEILNALRSVYDPDLQQDIVTLGFVRNISIKEGQVSFEINLTTPACPVKEKLRQEAVAAVSALPEVKEVEVRMTAEQARPSVQPEVSGMKGIRNIVAVGSGKGGVGKSTVAANIAAGLALTGAKVGLLDGDIYGPSQLMLMGQGEGFAFTEQKTLIPAEAYGVKFMSMGFLVPGDKPLIWRGPMAHKAFQETLFNVEWGDLDYLIVDLPPGTGDVHLTLVQSVQVTGAVLVSTPQDVGLTISLKTLRMFQSAQVKLLGMVENMSGFVCPHCGHEEAIFGSGGARAAAKRLQIPFLGEIPLDSQVRVQSDKGKPIVLLKENPISKAYHTLIGKLVSQIAIASLSPKLEIVEDPA